MGPDDVMRRNCPFYGRAMYQSRMVTAAKPFLLLGTNGNQCALVLESHAPCQMELNGEDPEWRECVLVQDIRMEADT